MKSKEKTLTESVRDMFAAAGWTIKRNYTRHLAELKRGSATVNIVFGKPIYSNKF